MAEGTMTDSDFEDRVGQVAREMFEEFRIEHLRGAAIDFEQQSPHNRDGWLCKATRHVKDEKYRNEQFDWRTNPYAR
jgi:hypothetical protein